jgi:hypothetical protein
LCAQNRTKHNGTLGPKCHIVRAKKDQCFLLCAPNRTRCILLKFGDVPLGRPFCWALTPSVRCPTYLDVCPPPPQHPRLLVAQGACLPCWPILAWPGPWGGPLDMRQRYMPACTCMNITEARFLLLTSKGGPIVLFCMPTRTKCVPFGPCQGDRQGYVRFATAEEAQQALSKAREGSDAAEGTPAAAGASTESVEAPAELATAMDANGDGAEAAAPGAEDDMGAGEAAGAAASEAAAGAVGAGSAATLSVNGARLVLTLLQGDEEQAYHQKVRILLLAAK